MYFASTVYHALPENRAKRVFRVIDHGSIYLLIAGTYSPFTLGVLGGGWGWTLFGIVWGLAAIGITMKSTGRAWHPIFSTCLYLVMGWLALIAVQPLWTLLPRSAIVWLAAGGVAYTGASPSTRRGGSVTATSSGTSSSLRARSATSWR